jgi:Protein kinase domain
VLERELGHGGMATVYLANDLKHNRPVAIKVLRRELAAALGPERFLREIQIAARLNHPNILPLHDSGEAAGFLYYAMPYVEGESLRARLQRERQLPVADALRISIQVAAALDCAHRHGVVHRDIKPENILITDEHCMVADFGIARALDVAGGEKLTETGLALGTPHYMSPEQAAGDSHLDGRSDIYSLACVLYEMLAGEPPFSGPTAQAILARHSVDPVPSLRTVRRMLPEAVEQAVFTALAKVPADRFTSAVEFSHALTSPSSAARRTRRVTPRIIQRAVPAAVAVLLAGAAGAWLALYPRGPKIVPSAWRIAVLPLAPTVADTALTRLGRDLVITVSANLDEVGEVRTVDAHTLLAQSANPTTGMSLPNAAALGRRFGAGSVVHGSIARLSQRLVRLDFGLFTSDSLTPIARSSITASPDSLTLLSDSVARALLQHIWRRGEPPSPSLDAALKTRSAPALRAFLEGEQALVENRWSDAAESYARAISADSTFWLPYWRYAFSQGYWEGREVDSAIVNAFQTHRAELPPEDRLSIESLMVFRDSFSVALARAKEVTQRFPDNWFAWLVYGDYLVHVAPILGHRVAEAGPVLERALQLNPRLTPAWEHLNWVYCKSRDPAGATRGLEAALARLKAGPSLEGAEGFNELLQFRLLARLAETGGKVDPVMIDSVARAIAKGGSATAAMAGWCGFLPAQVEISRQVLRLGPAPDVVARHRRVLAFTWAGRGAWDSVSVALDQLLGQVPNEWWSPLDGYALAVAGVWLGGLNARQAARQRGAAARVVEGLSVEEGQYHFQAIDGMLAWGLRDSAGWESARRELEKVDRVYTGWKNAPWERSLAAFQLALTGATRKAGATLASLEWERAERLEAVMNGAFPNYLTALDRLAASRWLFEAGDTAQAARLLTWNEAWGGVSGSVGGGVFASLAYLQRAQIEDARGNLPLAQEYYQEFLLRHDMPTPGQRHLVDEARAGLARLSGQRDVPAERVR